MIYWRTFIATAANTGHYHTVSIIFNPLIDYIEVSRRSSLRKRRSSSARASASSNLRCSSASSILAGQYRVDTFVIANCSRIKREGKDRNRDGFEFTSSVEAVLATNQPHLAAAFSHLSVTPSRDPGNVFGLN